MTWFTRYLTAYLHGRRLRRAEADLAGYDDLLLRDLGITRDQIPAYVAGDLSPDAPARPMLRLVTSDSTKDHTADCCADCCEDLAA